MRVVFLLLAILPAAFGQRLSFGVIGGGVVNDGLDPSARDFWEGKRYTFGPTVEFPLPFRLAGEVDALYKRTGSRTEGCTFLSCYFSSRRANVFEFPLLLKYRFGHGALRPFAAGGMAVEWVRPATHAGAVIGGGLEFHAGPMRLAPTFRYTRWSGRYWEAYGSHGYFTGSNRNQPEALFTVLF